MSYLSPSSFYSWLSGSKNSQRDPADQLSTVNGGLVPLDPSQRVVTTLDDDDEYAVVGLRKLSYAEVVRLEGGKATAVPRIPNPKGAIAQAPAPLVTEASVNRRAYEALADFSDEALGDAKYDPIRKSNRRKSFAGK